MQPGQVFQRIHLLPPANSESRSSQQKQRQIGADFGGDAQAMAMKQLMALTRQQGIVMAFADVFLMLAVLFAAFGALAVVMRRPAAAPGAAGGH